MELFRNTVYWGFFMSFNSNSTQLNIPLKPLISKLFLFSFSLPSIYLPFVAISGKNKMPFYFLHN